MTYLKLYKILFIVLLLIITVYILYKEKPIYTSKYKFEYEDYKSSGIADSNIYKYIKNIGVTLSSIASIYGGYKTYSHSEKNDASKQLEEMKQQLSKNTEELENLHSVKKSIIGHARHKSMELNNLIDIAKFKTKEADLSMNKVVELMNSLSTMQEGSQEKSTILKQIEEAKKIADLAREEARKSIDAISKNSIDFQREILDLDIKTNFIGLGLIEWIQNASFSDPIKQIALGTLGLNYVILSFLITIIYIYYGDYLIKRFNMEIKYPKLFKVIQYTKKFQFYYFSISIIAIASIAILQIFLSLWILI